MFDLPSFVVYYDSWICHLLTCWSKTRLLKSLIFDGHRTVREISYHL